MGEEQRYGSHSISRLTVHIVWVTKYRYKVLEGDIQIQCRTLIKKICDSEYVKILKGVVSKDHVQIQVMTNQEQFILLPIIMVDKL